MSPSLANTRAPSGIPHSLNVSHESGCGVVDIVRGSREKAQLMVNVAIEVLLSLSLSLTHARQTTYVHTCTHSEI